MLKPMEPTTATPVDLSADRSKLSPAEKFVLEMADKLAAADPERAALLQVERETDKYGESLRVYSPGPRWFQRSIMLSVRRPAKRSPELAELIGQRRQCWSFMGAMVIGRDSTGREIKARTYRAARILVDVYGD